MSTPADRQLRAGIAGAVAAIHNES